MEIKEILEKAANEFDIGTIQKTESATKGLSNENFFITTDKGEYVLRILEDQTLEGLKNEIAIEEQLSKTDILTAQLLRVKAGTPYFEIAEKIVTSSKKIPGEHPTEASPQLAHAIGMVLGEFHLVVQELPHPEYFWLKKEFATEALVKLPANPLGEKIKVQIQSSITIFDQKLPQGYIHGDLHLGNLIVTPEGKVAIFDFEGSGKDILLLDIAYSAVSLYETTPDLDGTLLKNVFEGYESVRPLSPGEKEGFNKAVLYVSAADAAWLLNEGYAQFAEDILKAGDIVANL